MPRINFVGSGHATPLPVGRVRFSAFDPGLDVDRPRIRQLEAAMRFIESQLASGRFARCDGAFRALPGRRSFSEVWSDNTIWINFTVSILARGFTHPNGHDVAISLAGFGEAPTQWRTVGATLVHELAHVNGAPGETRHAEETLIQCLFADHFDATIIG
jgi:hypothetical protein